MIKYNKYTTSSYICQFVQIISKFSQIKEFDGSENRKYLNFTPDKSVTQTFRLKNLASIITQNPDKRSSAQHII